MPDQMAEIVDRRMLSVLIVIPVAKQKSTASG